MTSARTFVVVNDAVRERCAAFIRAEVPDGWRITCKPQARKVEQNDRFHAMLSDIAKQWQFMGQSWHLEDVKRLMVDAFAEAMRQLGTPVHHDGRVIPSIDGKRVVQLGVQTREFYVGEASAFIDYLFAWGAENGIVWSDESRAA